jgi:AraC family transcriptional regulator, transcriptional activator FtrA
VAEKPVIDNNPPMRTRSAKTLSVVCIVYDQLSLFEAGIASEVFGIQRPELAAILYRFRMAQGEPDVLSTRGGMRIRAQGGLRLLRDADLVVVPGWRDH